MARNNQTELRHFNGFPKRKNAAITCSTCMPQSALSKSRICRDQQDRG